MSLLTKENPVVFPLVAASRLSVHNATGATLNAGEIVKLTGSETVAGIPDVEYPDNVADVFLGVLYEDIEDGKEGLCIVGMEVVEVFSGKAPITGNGVRAGYWAGIDTFNPGYARECTYSSQATIIGIFLTTTTTLGEKARMLILHALHPAGL